MISDIVRSNVCWGVGRLRSAVGALAHADASAAAQTAEIAADRRVPERLT
jgi:hypothetical protein